MYIRIDYLNKEKDVRHIFTTTEHCGYELEAILKQGANNICIYNIANSHTKIGTTGICIYRTSNLHTKLGPRKK